MHRESPGKLNVLAFGAVGVQPDGASVVGAGEGDCAVAAPTASASAATARAFILSRGGRTEHFRCVFTCRAARLSYGSELNHLHKAERCMDLNGLPFEQHDTSNTRALLVPLTTARVSALHNYV